MNSRQPGLYSGTLTALPGLPPQRTHTKKASWAEALTGLLDGSFLCLGDV